MVRMRNYRRQPLNRGSNFEYPTARRRYRARRPIVPWNQIDLGYHYDRFHDAYTAPGGDNISLNILTAHQAQMLQEQNALFGAGALIHNNDFNESHLENGPARYQVFRPNTQSYQRRLVDSPTRGQHYQRSNSRYVVHDSLNSRDNALAALRLPAFRRLRGTPLRRYARRFLQRRQIARAFTGAQHRRAAIGQDAYPPDIRRQILNFVGTTTHPDATP